MIALLISLSLSLAAIGFSLHLSVNYAKFNKNVENWAKQLDSVMSDAIARSARQLLRDLDSKISKLNENEKDSSL